MSHQDIRTHRKMYELVHELVAVLVDMGYDLRPPGDFKVTLFAHGRTTTYVLGEPGLADAERTLAFAEEQAVSCLARGAAMRFEPSITIDPRGSTAETAIDLTTE